MVKKAKQTKGPLRIAAQRSERTPPVQYSAKNSAAPVSKIRGAESSRKVLSLLAYFKPSSPTASIETLAKAIEVPKSTAYRYVALLRECGLIVEVDGGRYSLGPRVFGMARAAQAAMSYLDISRPIMERLTEATGEATFMLRRVGDYAVCLARSDPHNPVRIFLEIGSAVPLHTGASSKLLLAHLPTRDIESYLARAGKADSRLKEYAAKLRQQLEEIRSRGVAITIDEITPGVWACAAPIVEADRLVASISVAAPLFRIDRARRLAYEKMVKEAATEISAELNRLCGYPTVAA